MKKQWNQFSTPRATGELGRSVGYIHKLSSRFIWKNLFIQLRCNIPTQSHHVIETEKRSPSFLHFLPLDWIFEPFSIFIATRKTTRVLLVRGEVIASQNSYFLLLDSSTKGFPEFKTSSPQIWHARKWRRVEDCSRLRPQLCLTCFFEVFPVTLSTIHSFITQTPWCRYTLQTKARPPLSVDSSAFHTIAEKATPGDPTSCLSTSRCR